MRYTFNLKKAYDDYYLNSGDTVYSKGEKPKSEYVSPYKENYYLPEHSITKRMCYDKLGQLEDVEEICLKLKTEPLYEKCHGKIRKKDYKEYNIYYDFNSKSIVIYNCEYVTEYSMKDYGKTWALNKEALL